MSNLKKMRTKQSKLLLIYKFDVRMSWPNSGATCYRKESFITCLSAQQSSLKTSISQFRWSLDDNENQKYCHKA